MRRSLSIILALLLLLIGVVPVLASSDPAGQSTTFSNLPLQEENDHEEGDDHSDDDSHNENDGHNEDTTATSEGEDDGTAVVLSLLALLLLIIMVVAVISAVGLGIIGIGATAVGGDDD